MSTKAFRFRAPRITAPANSPVVAPGTGGMVTDTDVTQLTPTESPYMQDVVFPNGIACFRGGLISMGTVLTGASNVCGLLVTDEIPPATIGSNVYHWGLANGQIQNSLGGTATIISAVKRIPYVVFQNEILWFAQDGVSSILRTPAAPIGPGVSGAGTISAPMGGQTITGVGTAFLAYNGVSAYLSAGNQPGQNYLLQRASTSLLISVSTPMAVAVAGATYSVSPTGMIGLCTQVTDIGTCANALGTVTGQGTDWDHDGPGYAKVQSTDLICAKGTAGAGQFSSVVSGITGASLNATGGTWAALPYRIQRQLVGTHGCVHNGRLIVTGCAWQRRRVYYTPLASSTQVAGLGLIPWTLGDPTNGNLSYAVQPGDANICDFIDIGDANQEGEIIAVASTASGILALGTDGAWLIAGDFPNETVVNLAPDADCVSAQSVVVTHGSVFWAGSQGIFQFTGGRVVDITAKKRNAELRLQLMAAGGSNAILTGWSCKGHYALSMGVNPVTTWTYDITRGVWCGNHTITALAACTVVDQDEAYIVPNVAVGNQNPCQTHSVYAEPSASGYVPAGTDAHDPNAVFVLELPPAAAGDSITQKRVTEVMLRMAWQTSAVGVKFQSVMDPGNVEGVALRPVFGTDATFLTNTGGIQNPNTQRIRPVTDVTSSSAGSIGQQGRIFRSQITTPAVSGSYALKIHEVTMFTRTFAQNR